jgi:hypothetical protein
MNDDNLVFCRKCGKNYVLKKGRQDNAIVFKEIENIQRQFKIPEQSVKFITLNLNEKFSFQVLTCLCENIYYNETAGYWSVSKR